MSDKKPEVITTVPTKQLFQVSTEHFPVNLEPTLPHYNDLPQQFKDIANDRERMKTLLPFTGETVAQLTFSGYYLDFKVKAYNANVYVGSYIDNHRSNANADWQKRVGSKFAIKYLEITDLSRQSQILNEIKVNFRLDHPNLVKYLDLEIYVNSIGILQIFFVLEYCNGPPLRSYLYSNIENVDFSKYPGLPQKPTYQLAQQWAVQIISAIDYLHSKRLIHHDLHQNNVMVCNVDGKWIMKVIDFDQSFEWPEKEADRIGRLKYDRHSALNLIDDIIDKMEVEKKLKEDAVNLIKMMVAALWAHPDLFQFANFMKHPFLQGGKEEKKSEDRCIVM